MDLSSLEGLRVSGKPKSPWWDPPTRQHIVHGNVLAFDQSFSSTGWVHLRSDVNGVSIFGAGTFKTEQGALRGGEQDLERAGALYDWILEQIVERQPEIVLYETPPKGPGIHNPEVSLLCALAIRLAARVCAYSVASVHAKTGKRMLTGNSNADKKTAHAVLMNLDWIEGLDIVKNEGQRDALMVALAHLRVR